MIDPVRQQMLDDLVAGAHAAHDGRTAEVKHAILDGLRGMEAEHPWVKEVLEQDLLAGVVKHYADWRRRYTIAGKTKTGDPLDVPRYGAVVERDEEGAASFRQMGLEEATLGQVQERYRRLVTQRNTISAEAAFLLRVIRAMEADPSLTTAGEALRKLDSGPDDTAAAL